MSKPWAEVLESKECEVFEAELRKEVALHSTQFYKEARLLARRFDQDDFLFETKNAQWLYTIVHLTFSGKAESLPWPMTRLYESVAAVEAIVAKDAEAYQA